MQVLSAFKRKTGLARSRFQGYQRPSAREADRRERLLSRRKDAQGQELAVADCPEVGASPVDADATASAAGVFVEHRDHVVAGVDPLLDFRALVLPGREPVASIANPVEPLVAAEAHIHIAAHLEDSGSYSACAASLSRRMNASQARRTASTFSCDRRKYCLSERR
jgi:hypothetical protein